MNCCHMVCYYVIVSLYSRLLAGDRTLPDATHTGPGRDILCSGWQALVAGRPDMNSLVGLGAGELRVQQSSHGAVA